jgi:deoxyribonuclease IV
MSIAGGLHCAVERAAEAGCDVVQVFTKSNSQWGCKPLLDSDCAIWRKALADHAIDAPIAHTSYLINLAAVERSLFDKSVDALVIEWQRCERLGIGGLVMHPGAHTTATAEDGLARVVAGIQTAIERVQPATCKLLLENTAGQGSCLGWNVEQLGWLIAQIESPHVGICWDTCHALAAGYDFRTATGLKELVSKLEQQRLLPLIAAVHVNDSKKDCGSRVDRHEHIGQGCIGEAGMRRFLKSAAFKAIPMYLETPKGTDEQTGQDWDLLNLTTLRRLAGQ